MYIPVKNKFYFCLTASMLWVVLCIYLATPWMESLAKYMPFIIACFLVYSIAIIPGYIYMFLALSLLADHRPQTKYCSEYPGLTILIPDYNESNKIVDTVESIQKNGYEGPLEIIVVDDGSTDRTSLILTALPGIKVLNNNHKGKAEALNAGLREAKYDLIVSVDSDTYLWRNALKNIVERMYSDPQNTAAVAGAVLARNSRKNMLTKLQEWDYFLGIGSIKRMQSLFQGTLVVQGAFSIYRKDILKKIGGWRTVVGEDIVLTWDLLSRGYRTGFAENAVSFTNVPETYKAFYQQKKRWARGMIEGFKYNPRILFQDRFSTLFIFWNLAFPMLDSVYLFIFVPGIILALFGYFFIAGPYTLLVLPLTFIMNYLMFTIQNKMFYTQGLKVRRNLWGFLMYITVYQFFLSPASVSGYFTELLSLKKTWGSR
ncbi:MAG: glycosyltransferase family 2 protein [Elusimicrobia bacterium]|nr:glycosyltransferase family 2 protein [Candidatus Liberimonas magnetica]